jgi:hypothetical protein
MPRFSKTADESRAPLKSATGADRGKKQAPTRAGYSSDAIGSPRGNIRPEGPRGTEAAGFMQAESPKGSTWTVRATEARKAVAGMRDLKTPYGRGYARNASRGTILGVRPDERVKHPLPDPPVRHPLARRPDPGRPKAKPS